MSSNLINLFSNSNQSSSYAQFRPRYPDRLYEVIANELNDKKCLFALDIGCGTGQCTVKLVDEPLNVKEVIGIDVSATQIQNAESKEGITYKQASMNDINDIIQDKKVDLITVAQAFHWFDYDDALRKLHSVLYTPGSMLAVWGYSNPRICDNSDADHLVNEAFYKDILKECWSDRRLIIENRYKTIESIMINQKDNDDNLLWDVIRYDSHENDENDDTNSNIEYNIDKKISIQLSMTVDELCGYLSSWSGYNTWLKKHPNETPAIDTLKEQLSLYYPNKNDTITLNAPVFIIFGKRRAR